jgi:phage-related protein
MQDPMFSVETIDAAVDYQQEYNEAMQSDADFYIAELDTANKKIDELYHFIEMTEALTYDQATAKRISTFLTEQGVWKRYLQKD